MRHNSSPIALALLAGSLLLSTVGYADKKDKKDQAAFTELAQHCEGRPREQRPAIVVKRFTISPNAQGAVANFGAMMAAKLTNALSETNCFRVLEADLGDLKSEIELGEKGITDGSSPQSGQMKGAQAVVTAQITEYSEGSSNNSFRVPGRFGSVGAIRTGSKKATIGVTLKIVDPQTREQLYSKELVTTGQKGGWQGMDIGAFSNGSSGQLSEAMNAAIRECIYLMTERVVMDFDKIGLSAPAAAKAFNPADCKMLANGASPKVMVILPEYHIQRRIPDPAGETEIIRKLTEAGFHTVDAAMYATLRNGDRFADAAKDPMGAISLGKQFGADIVIFGEAFSEMTGREGNNITCRARVEAKAVRTDNAQIIATNGFDAGSQDIAESTGSKRALRSAGSLVADYMLQQFCNKDMRFGSGAKTAGDAAVPAGNRTIITVNNTNYSKLTALCNSLKSSKKIKDVQKTLNGGEGTITVVHEGSSESIADMITQTMAKQAEVTGVEDGKIILSGK